MQYRYDQAGNLTKITDALGQATQASYNSQGLPLTQANALGHTSRLTYDAAGNLLTAANPLGETITHGYDARGRRNQTTSAQGRVQTIRYDQAGRVIEVMAPGQSQGQGAKTRYDANGRPAEVTSPSGLVVKTFYDTQGRVVRTEDPSGNTSTYEYGANGTPQAGLLTVVNYPTYKESYQYDQRGRQVAVNQYLSADQILTHRFGYDAMGRRISSTDPANRATLFQYVSHPGRLHRL